MNEKLKESSFSRLIFYISICQKLKRLCVCILACTHQHFLVFVHASMQTTQIVYDLEMREEFFFENITFT